MLVLSMMTHEHELPTAVTTLRQAFVHTMYLYVYPWVLDVDVFEWSNGRWCLAFRACAQHAQEFPYDCSGEFVLPGGWQRQPVHPTVVFES